MAETEGEGRVGDAAALRAANRDWRDILAGRLVIERHRDEHGRRYVYARPVKLLGSGKTKLTERASNRSTMRAKSARLRVSRSIL